MQLVSCHPLGWLTDFGKNVCTPGWESNIKTSVKVKNLRVSTEFARLIVGISTGNCAEASSFTGGEYLEIMNNNQILRNSLLHAVWKKYLLACLLT